MCARGAADVPNDRVQLALLKQDETGWGTLVSDLPSLSGWSADQVLASEAFGYFMKVNSTAEELLQEVSILAGKRRRSPRENARHRRLREKLRTVLLSEGATVVERELRAQHFESVRRSAALLEKKLFGDSK